MDVEQWQECEMWLMAPYVQRNASERKKRLLAVAFCRHVSLLISAARCKQLLKWAELLSAFVDEPVPKRSNCLLRAVQEAERCADGIIQVEDLAPLCHVADRLSFVGGYYYACYDESWGARDYKLIASSEAAAAVYEATRPQVDIENVHKRAAWAVHRGGGSDENQVDPDEERAQCELVRDLFPNPDCHYNWQSKWSTPTVTELANAIYQRRAFDELPALGKALRKAGCDNTQVLAHCKASHPHVRGCWVVDAILGRT